MGSLAAFPRHAPASCAGWLPRLNNPAPDFLVETAQGRRGLADYRGRWLLLFCQSRLDAGLCRQDLVALAGAYPGFEALDCDLLCITACGPQRQGQLEPDLHHGRSGLHPSFPVVHGFTEALARSYGMQCLGSQGGRAAFLIDGRGILRARVTYPPQRRCSASGLLQQLRRLQAMDRMLTGTDGVQASPWYF